MKYSNIVLAIEQVKGNEKTLNLVAKLAKAHDAKITILQIVEPIPVALKNVLKNEYKLNFEKHIQSRIKEEKILIDDEILDFNLEVDVKIIEGEPTFEIIKYCVRSKSDLLVLKDRTKSSMKEKFFGSNTIKILRKNPCNVWVITDALIQNTSTTVLAAVDVVHSEETFTKQNKEIILRAFELAKIFNKKVHIINTFRHFGEEFQKGHWGLEEVATQKIDINIHNDHQQKLENLVKNISFAGLEVIVETIKGEASNVIRDLAKKDDINLVTMGTISRSGLQGFIMGNTAEKVLRDMSKSILAIKPNTFQCPLEF